MTQESVPSEFTQAGAVKSVEHQRLMKSLAGLNSALLSHPVYGLIADQRSLQLFMEAHVFAVWDFMALLKELQRRLTCVEVPWVPPTNPIAARLINEIVLGEETDEIAPGMYMSHFELYLAAMEEVDADTRPVRALARAVGHGLPVERALKPLPIPDATRGFVQKTLEMTKGSDHAVAAAFLLGREELIPDLFRKILEPASDDSRLECAWFRTYLERHIEVDEGEHGPMARRLLVSLCGNDETKWNDVERVAREALEARILLWNAAAQQIVLKRDTPPLSVVRSRRLR
jgi:hypothetical protein